MEKVVFVAKNHQQAEKQDIRQHREKTPDERLIDFIELRRRLYGKKTVDVKEYERCQKN